MSERSDKTGRFIRNKNTFKTIDGLIYCFNPDGELLFFTDDKRVTSYSWGKLAKGYASAYINGKQFPVHRFVSKPKEDEIVDHINRNKKDNRRENLRNTNKSENAFNSKMRPSNTSGCTGVWLRSDTSRWAAEIKKDGRKINLGCFKTKDEAIKARKDAEVRLYGYQL